jgi:hypothetical protein
MMNNTDKTTSLMKMFPNATRRARKREVRPQDLPDDRNTGLMIVLAIIGLPVIMVLIAIVTYLGQKYNW